METPELGERSSAAFDKPWELRVHDARLSADDKTLPKCVTGVRI